MQFSGEDRLLHRPMSHALGYGVFGRSYGWGGWGGSLVIFEPDTRMTVAYVTNQMADPAEGADTRGMEMVMASYDGLTGPSG